MICSMHVVNNIFLDLSSDFSSGENLDLDSMFAAAEKVENAIILFFQKCQLDKTNSG